MLVISMVVYLLRLACCLPTTNQPDTPPTFKSSNTRFSHSSRSRAVLVEIEKAWIQVASATPGLKASISSAIASAGVLQPRVFLGRLSSSAATSFSHV
jgi:hypothetical protein